MKKITAEIEQFISNNHTLRARALAALIEEKFHIKVSHVAVEPYLTKARVEAEAQNNAKVEAVRAKILDDADAYAGKYLKILDDEITSLVKLIANTPDIEIESVKERAAASQALQKCIGMVLEFAKPAEGPQVNITLPVPLEERQKQYEEYFEKLENDAKGESAISGDSPGQPVLQTEAHPQAS